MCRVYDVIFVTSNKILNGCVRVLVPAFMASVCVKHDKRVSLVTMVTNKQDCFLEASALCIDRILGQRV